jgi:GTPase SAR1 family protein
MSKFAVANQEVIASILSLGLDYPRDMVVAALDWSDGNGDLAVNELLCFMRIDVCMLTGKTISLWVRRSYSVLTVGHMISERTGVEPEFRRLTFAGKRLEDDRKLSDYNIGHGSTLFCHMHSGLSYLYDPISALRRQKAHYPVGPWFAAYAYSTGRGVERNLDRAFELLLPLKGTSDLEAIWQTTRAFLDGRGEVFDDFADMSRLLAKVKGDDEALWISSMQFEKRLDERRQLVSSDLPSDMLRCIARVADLVGGAAAVESDASTLARALPMLVPGNEVPLELYVALKYHVNARVEKLAVRSLLPLVCVLEELTRAVQSLDFEVSERANLARLSVRACLLGAICVHVSRSYALLPTDLTNTTTLETSILYIGLMHQLEFFGLCEPDLTCAVVEGSVREELDAIARSSLRDQRTEAHHARYARMTVDKLRRRVPHLLITSPEFAAASAAVLDGEVEDKRVKVILLGSSGAGKTQVRRRLCNQQFQVVHASTDTAEVTSVEVTCVALTSANKWIERDGGVLGSVRLFDAAAGRSLASADRFVVASGARAMQGADKSQQAVAIHAQGAESALERANDRSLLGFSATVQTAGVATSSQPVAVVGTTPRSTSVISTMAAEPLHPSRDDVVARVAELDFEIVDERKVLSLWDFGGQPEYFIVHDLFLTRGAVYMLVVDWTVGVDQARESAQRWMDAIRAHVSVNAMVLPVLPRCDANSCENVILKRVAVELEELVGCAPVRIDSAADINYGELKRQLLRLAVKCMADNGKVRMLWLQVHDELCRMRGAEKRQWITRGEFRELLQSLQSNEVSDGDVQRALEYLKQSGTVLTCGGGGRVSEYVFLDPELFLELVRPLVNTHEQVARRRAAARGDVVAAAAQRRLSSAYECLDVQCTASRELLEHMWRDVRSPGEDKVGFFVELLEHCGLMCPLDSNKFFVPAASKATVRRSTLVLEWVADAEQIALVCSDSMISALPPSLIPRVVASLFKSGAIVKLNRERVVSPSDVVLLLRANGGADVRRLRLRQSGNALAMTLQRCGDDDQAAARAWRVGAYVVLYAAVEGVLRQVCRNLSLHVQASVLCTQCNEWQASNVCSNCDKDLASIDAWLPRAGDGVFSLRNDWRVMAVTNEPTLTFDIFVARPTLDALLNWCGEHCDGVREARIYEFPAEVRDRADFWTAVHTVADLYRNKATYDAALFYPGREVGGNVLRENDLANAIRRRLSGAVYYADCDRDGKSDDNIAAAAVGCRRAVFVVSRMWFERKWCLAEMLLAMASGDDNKCKVIEFSNDFPLQLLPLNRRVIRERFDAQKLTDDEAARFAAWVQSSMSIDKVTDDNNDIDLD